MLPYLVLLGSYLIGAIPFGYLIARMKGVNLFQVGSGNIGATNVSRVLGKKLGILVFGLDFLKGALPVALVPQLPLEVQQEFGSPSTLQVLVAMLAFLGHLFPIYLGFRGGKGVATGAGTVAVLMPLPALTAILIWLATATTSLMVSLGSIAAVVGLTISRLLTASEPFGGEQLPVTLFCLVGTLVVISKHGANIMRMLRGTESSWPDSERWQIMSKTIHLLAVGLWFGSAIFFNFLAAPAMNHSFKEAVFNAPSDRTANLPITSGLDDDQKASLSTALFGTAVGPLFPRFFALQGICSILALITAFRWWNLPGKANRWRVILLIFGVALVAASWPISQHVSELRLERYSTDLERAALAKSAFAIWHLISLLLSAMTALLTIIVMCLAARLPSSSTLYFAR